jgi:hypothetical protein
MKFKKIIQAMSCAAQRWDETHVGPPKLLAQAGRDATESLSDVQGIMIKGQQLFSLAFHSLVSLFSYTFPVTVSHIYYLL